VLLAAYVVAVAVCLVRDGDGWCAALVAISGGVAFFFFRSAERARVVAEERAALSEQLRQMELKYRSTFDNAVEGIFQTTPDGRFLTANRALARMYGYSSPEHLIAGLTDIGAQLYVEPEQREALIGAMQQEDIISDFEVEVLRADGRTMWIRENVHAVRDEAGQLLYLEGTVEDISDRWWSEQRRRLQFATARVLEKAGSVAEARPMILKAICEILEWHMGAVWDVNDAAGELQCAEVWHAADIDIAEFERVNSRVGFHLGHGLVGEVWRTGEPKWIADLSHNARSPGACIALKHGMGSAFCVPIKVHGEVRHVVEFYSPTIALPDPELLQTLGIIGNQLGHLVERKGAEEALRKSEVRKAAILRSALDCIMSFDADGRIVEFNPAAERTFGYKPGEAIGRDIAELVVQESLGDKLNAVLTPEKVPDPASALGRRVELIAVRKNGSEFPAEVAVSRIMIDGRPIFTAYLRDITERKEAEQLTSELAAVVANSNDAIVACTLDGIVRSWNMGAERIYGFSAREMIGQPLHTLIPAERQDEFPQMLMAVRRGESLADHETLRLRKDGKKISVALTDSPIRGEGDRITGLSSIARDITERKRLEEELLQSQKMDAVGRLAGGIAHDFNNILTAVLGYSDLLIGQIDDRHWMYKHLSEIRKAADFAASLTQQLLAFSRRQPLYLRVFGINDTVRNLQKMLQRVIGEHIRIQTVLSAEKGRIKADPGQLEQVLLNLCVNARDAMPGGGVITIATSDVTHAAEDSDALLAEMPSGEYVRLTVTDTGTGISPEVIKHIFEPFFTTKDKGQGTGLGLATCYGIVKQSGGYIAVDSIVGTGSTFSIFLPRVEESGEKAQPRSNGNGAMPGGSETILYVEDEHSVRSLTSHVLRRLGYKVLEASDGGQAREVAEAHNGQKIDLLFSDVVLPDFGGRALADWLCERSRSTRVLFTSGYVDEGVLRRYGVEPGLPFLQKPFTPADLARKVREVMDTADASELKPPAA
jgi:PAS domain S-box-containing protein